MTIRTRLPRLEILVLSGPSFGGVIVFSCAENQQFFSRAFLRAWRRRVKMPAHFLFVGCDSTTGEELGWSRRVELKKREGELLAVVIPHCIQHERRSNASEYTSVLHLFCATAPWERITVYRKILLGHLPDLLFRTVGTFTSFRPYNGRRDRRIEKVEN